MIHENPYKNLPTPNYSETVALHYQSAPHTAEKQELGPVGSTIVITAGVLAVGALIALSDRGNIFPWSKGDRDDTFDQDTRD